MVPFIDLTDACGVAGPLLGVKDDPLWVRYSHLVGPSSLVPGEDASRSSATCCPHSLARTLVQDTWHLEGARDA